MGLGVRGRPSPALRKKPQSEGRHSPSLRELSLRRAPPAQGSPRLKEEAGPILKPSRGPWRAVEGFIPAGSAVTGWSGGRGRQVSRLPVSSQGLEAGRVGRWGQWS